MTTYRNWTGLGQRPCRRRALAIPLPRSRHPAPTPPPTGWAPVKNINNHLITFGTKLNLRAHRNIKHYIINTKNFSSIFVAPGGVPTPSWRVSTIYIYMYSSTQYIIPDPNVYSTQYILPDPNVYSTQYILPDPNIYSTQYIIPDPNICSTQYIIPDPNI